MQPKGTKFIEIRPFACSEELIQAENDLLCPSSQATVRVESDSYVRASCGARYQTILGIPILAKNVEITSHDRIDERAITDLAAFLKSETGIDRTNDPLACMLIESNTCRRISGCERSPSGPCDCRRRRLWRITLKHGCGGAQLN